MIVQGLYMLLVPTTSVGYDAEKEERAEQEAKMAKISAIEEAKERLEEKFQSKVLTSTQLLKIGTGCWSREEKRQGILSSRN